ncbi:MAG TPA: peptidoglycan-binding domain-containing protein [Thermoanaerobaculia bacterium]|nr:peptidoglycan-binding domain-containing protein [Thermoanaerobaculia bacterium]
MPPLFEVFADAGGFWLLLLGVLAWIASARLPSVADEHDAVRWVRALSQPWLMKAAVGLALLAWIWNFGRLFFGDAFLRGAGTFAELSTALLVLILVLAGIAWMGIRSWPHLHPWLTYGLVLILMLSSAPLLPGAPEGVLSQETQDQERRAVTFLQGRLAQLGCFGATGEPDRRDGTFEALTASAVISFQQANELIHDPRLDMPGVIRPRPEFRLLARPFPFLFGPKRCPDASREAP